jgi:hypothetical protein
MSLIAPIFYALTEFVSTKLSLRMVAERWRLPAAELSKTYEKIQEHFWHGKLARALANPADRPELIPLLTDLTRLEDQYADLMFQYRRAELTASEIRTLPEPNLFLQIKADTFAFRVHQAAARTIRELQKARSLFEKTSQAEQTEADQANQTEAPSPALSQNAAQAKSSAEAAPRKDSPKDSRKDPQKDIAPEPAAQPIGAETPQQESQQNPPADSAQLSSESPSPLESPHQPAIETQPPPSPPNDPLVENCLLRNRQRIKNAAPKDRPALIEQLIALERAKRARLAA